jgi:hypothetical protein
MSAIYEHYVDLSYTGLNYFACPPDEWGFCLQGWFLEQTKRIILSVQALPERIGGRKMKSEVVIGVGIRG